MGNDSPDDSPDIDPDKWYCCHVTPHQDLTPATGCDQEALGGWSCCKQGVNIQIWLDGGWECSDILDPFMELCVRTGFSAQRLINLSYPFDTQAACIAACAP